jgi:hypothetical protein
VGRQGLTGEARVGVLRRLAEHVETRYRTWRAFEEESRLPHATVDAWRLGTAVPDLPVLMHLAKRDRSLDLNWLLLDRGPTGWVRQEEVDRLIQTLARGALTRIEEERTKLLKRPRRKPSPKHKRRSS